MSNMIEKEERYNGWTNRDTWLVMLWLENDYNNYLVLQRKIKGEGSGSKKKLQNLNCCELMFWIRHTMHFGDEINWHNVNMNEIKKAILEEVE